MDQTKLDKLYNTLCIVLGVLYLPYALFCFLCYMATEIALWETNPVLIGAASLFAYSGVFSALTAHLCLLLSRKFRSSGKWTAAWIAMFLPVLIMIVASLLYIAVDLVVGI